MSRLLVQFGGKPPSAPIRFWIAGHSSVAVSARPAQLRVGRPGLLVCVAVVTTTTAAQEWDSTNRLHERIDSLERQIDRMGSRTGTHGYGCGLAILFGGFCALWAQNTGRNPWLWFFMGVLFNCITVVVLLVMNAQDLSAKGDAAEPPSEPGPPDRPEGEAE